MAGVVVDGDTFPPSPLTPTPSDNPAVQDDDIFSRHASALRIGTIAAIAVSCTLVLLVLVAVLARFCLLPCRNLLTARRRGGKDKRKSSDYEKLDDDVEAANVSKPGQLESAFALDKPRSGSTPTINIDTSPTLRIHPVSLEAPAARIGTPPGRKSPQFTHSLHHCDIPFQLPPLSPRMTETLHVQPDIFGSSRRSSATSSIDSSTLGCEQPVEHEVPRLHPTSPSRDSIQDSPNRARNMMIGRIQPELYRYSKASETELPQSRRGRVWFSYVYDGAVESLTVKVIKVKQLPGRNNSNSPRDSFVKLFLLPDERISQQTKVRPRNNNPLFNESFVFQVSDSDIKSRSLRLSVYDLDKRKSTRHLLGHALVSLNDIDPSRADEVMWRDLDEIAHPGDTGTSLGELHVSLAYNPALDRLTVVILEAKNLRQMDLQETDIFVRVELTQGHKVVKTKRTLVQEGAADPKYKESFSFKVTSKDMEKTCLSIDVITTNDKGQLRKVKSAIKSVVTRGRYSAEHNYGRVAIGCHMFCRGEQLLHWHDMLAHPRKTINKWHSLSEVVCNH